MKFDEQYSRQARRPRNQGLILDVGKKYVHRIQTGSGSQAAPFLIETEAFSPGHNDEGK
jgi:hypothetical protein